MYITLSLALGIVSWILPMISMLGENKKDLNFFILTSLACSLMSIYFQILMMGEVSEINVVVLVESISSLEVAIGALITLTLLLNLISIFVNNKKINK